jgi:hypothetical protein
MKGMVYDFVKSNTSRSKIYVTDNLEDLENLHNAEFVYGVGLKDKFAEVGIKGIDLKDVLADSIISRNWNPKKISELCLPYLNGKYIPYFKYLKNAGFINEEGRIDEDIDVAEFSPEFIKKVNDVTLECFYPAAGYIKKLEVVNEKYNSFKELRENEDNLHILVYTPLLDIEKINLEDLLEYLKENIDLLNDSKYGTHFRKLICLYDYLKFIYIERKPK